MFYQWETARLRLKIQEKDEPEAKPLEGYKLIVVSLDQGKGRGMYHGDYFFEAGSPDVSVENSYIDLYFSQEEAGKYADVTTKVQVNILYDDTERDTTVEGKIKVLNNLYKKVMT